METKNLEKDTVVFQEGDTSDVAYFIVSGKVELSQAGRGQASLVKVIGENEIFGELAVFDPSALRPSQAKVQENASLIAITPESLEALFQSQPAPMQALLKLAFDKMRQTRTKTISRHSTVLSSDIKKLTIKPVGEKMAALFKPQEIALVRLPYRIGGFPEGGEANRRDFVHLAIPCQGNPLRVSRQHCEITFEDGVLTLTDLGSRFCTTVNGTIIGRGRGNYSIPLLKGENHVTLGSEEGQFTFSIVCE